MGEIADWITEQPECDDGWEPSSPEDYLDMTDDELKRKTARARSKLLKGIRAWPNPLSDKQRWRLAEFLARGGNAEVSDAKRSLD